MDALQFFLQQYETIHMSTEATILNGLSDEQLRGQPVKNQNSLAWLLWHATRWEDFALTVIDPKHPQILNQENWLERLNLCRRDGGTGMTPDDCVDFNAQVNIAGLRDYWTAVGSKTREVVLSLSPAQLDQPIDESYLRQGLADGMIGNERARWLEQFLSGRTVAWFLSLVIWHNAEHLLGEAWTVRSLTGIPLDH